MKWSENDIKKAITLNENGERFATIAKILNRTTRSVQVKLNKLGYGESKINYNETLICLNCNKSFISQKKDKRKYCSQSCAAQRNNKNHPKRKKSNLSKCLNCNKELTRSEQKYCNHKYQSELKTRLIYEKIEQNEGSFYTQRYKDYLIQKHGEKCMICGWNEIHPLTKKVPIQLEHKDGNSENNNLDNLELLCPNHHSLTLTFGSLNRGNGRELRRIRRREQKIKERDITP